MQYDSTQPEIVKTTATTDKSWVVALAVLLFCVILFGAVGAVMLRTYTDSAKTFFADFSRVGESQFAQFENTSQAPYNSEVSEALEKSFELLEAGDNLGALNLIQGVEHLAVDNYEYENAIGLIYMNNHLFEEAVEHLQRSIELNDNFRASQNNMCFTLISLGTLEDATASCLRAIEIDPTIAKSYLNLGIIYVDLEQHDKSREYYLQALAVNKQKPVLTPEELAAVYNNLSLNYYRRGDCAQSLSMAQKALSYTPDDKGVKNQIELCQALIDNPKLLDPWPSPDAEAFDVSSCQETDGGMAFYKKGTANVVKLDGSSHQVADSCNGNQIREVYCLSKRLKVSYNNCPNGCYDGACLK